MQLGDMVVTPYLTSENGKEYIKGKALTLKYDIVEQGDYSHTKVFVIYSLHHSVSILCAYLVS